MSASYLLQQVLNALQVAGFYALIAVAYVLIHGVTNRINLAFGAIAMWGGSMTIAGFLLAGAALPYATALPLAFAILYGLVASLLAGIVIARFPVRPLAHQPGLAMLIATIGLAIVLEEMVRIASGSRELWMEPVYASSIRLTDNAGFNARITPIRILVLLACAGLVAALLVLLKRTDFGRRWRAVSDDAFMARLIGVDVDAVVTRTVVLACLSAGAAGALMAVLYGNSSFYGGLTIGLKALYVAILGGLASPAGAILGALALGGFETAWSSLFDATYRDVASFTAMTLLLILRPSGLSGDPLKRPQV